MKPAPAIKIALAAEELARAYKAAYKAFADYSEADRNREIMALVAQAEREARK